MITRKMNVRTGQFVQFGRRSGVTRRCPFLPSCRTRIRVSKPQARKLWPGNRAPIPFSSSNICSMTSTVAPASLGQWTDEPTTRADWSGRYKTSKLPSHNLKWFAFTFGWTNRRRWVLDRLRIDDVRSANCAPVFLSWAASAKRCGTFPARAYRVNLDNRATVPFVAPARTGPFTSPTGYAVQPSAAEPLPACPGRWRQELGIGWSPRAQFEARSPGFVEPQAHVAFPDQDALRSVPLLPVPTHRPISRVHIPKAPSRARASSLCRDDHRASRQTVLAANAIRGGALGRRCTTGPLFAIHLVSKSSATAGTQRPYEHLFRSTMHFGIAAVIPSKPSGTSHAHSIRGIIGAPVKGAGSMNVSASSRRCPYFALEPQAPPEHSRGQVHYPRRVRRNQK